LLLLGEFDSWFDIQNQIKIKFNLINNNIFR
jgi:hypothetical protein